MVTAGRSSASHGDSGRLGGRRPLPAALHQHAPAGTGGKCLAALVAVATDQTILTQRQVFGHVTIEFPDLIQDHLQSHLVGSRSGTFVSSCVMTNPQDVFLPEHGESSLPDLP